jgi:hypothetical protein
MPQLLLSLVKEPTVPIDQEAGLVTLEKRKISCLCQELNQNFLGVQFIA